MKTLLRHAPTGQYFESLEKWTPNPGNAYDFQLVSRALRFVEKARFRGMELVLSLDKAEPPASWGMALDHIL
jgi:hypothetical protein